jgi:hypothetical protein
MGRMPTTLISGNLLTAQISATDVSTAGSTSVTVTNPLPGGGASNSKNFTVPCNIPAPVAAASQAKARVGAYFFDGWTGSLSNFQCEDTAMQERSPYHAISKGAHFCGKL